MFLTWPFSGRLARKRLSHLQSYQAVTLKHVYWHCGINALICPRPEPAILQRLLPAGEVFFQPLSWSSQFQTHFYVLSLEINNCAVNMKSSDEYARESTDRHKILLLSSLERLASWASFADSKVTCSC